MEKYLTKKEEFLKGFDDDKNKSLVVKVTVPNCPKHEFIINNKDNFQGKKEYYKNAYSDELELISFPNIKIVDYKWSTTAVYYEDFN